MKGRPVDQLVYECMFQKPKVSDPQNFHAVLQRSLIPEVRQETHAFYGHLDTQEAKYPGLDYTHATHRLRLCRWPWHRRMFRAFDVLGLTPAEISGLTKWEGTRWAKEKFEREQGIVIRDTTADCFSDDFDNVAEIDDRPIPPAPAPAPVPAPAPAPPVADTTTTMPTPTHRRRVLPAMPRIGRPAFIENVLGAVAGDNDNDNNGVGNFLPVPESESDDEVQSVGVELNRRLRTQAARREAGDTTAILDEEWEQWLKNAIDSGELFLITERLFRPGADPSVIPPTLFPPGMLSAARAGHWSEIPEFLHSMLQRTLQVESGRGHEAPVSMNTGSVTVRPLPNISPEQFNADRARRGLRPIPIAAARRGMQERVYLRWARQTGTTPGPPIGDDGPGQRVV